MIGWSLLPLLLTAGIADQSRAVAEPSLVSLYELIASDIGLGIVCYPVGPEGKVQQRWDDQRKAQFRDVRRKLIALQGAEPIQAVDDSIDETNATTSYVGCPSDEAERHRRSRLRYNLQKLNRRIDQLNRRYRAQKSST